MFKLLAFALAALATCLPSASAMHGILLLDELTFNKVVDGSRDFLVKFDDPVRFHSARRRGKASRDDFFRDFAKSIAHGEESGLPGMLLVEVNVKERDPKFGREDVLRDRYLTDEEEELPAYRLFKKGSLTPVPFRPVEQSVEEFKRFLRKEIGLYSELGGCLKEMDVIVKAFVSTTNPDERAKLYNDALMQSKTYTQPYQHESTEYYLKTMEKVMGDGGLKYVEQETSRLEKMAKSKVSGDKRKQFQVRLNILSSFKAPTPHGDSDDEN